mgnify:CR=1 FL=1
MIIEGITSAFKSVIQTLLGFINIPGMPQSFVASIDSFLDMVFGNVGLVGLFVRWDTVKIGIPILIAIANMDKIYDGVMWIIRKIPMAGMS